MGIKTDRNKKSLYARFFVSACIKKDTLNIIKYANLLIRNGHYSKVELQAYYDFTHNRLWAINK